jgi:GNAT superfamily N-acetyltransferase
MSGYRFCRTDDIGLLVDALNRCWAPHFPHEPLMTPAAFKRSIRDLQIWCSSCMVAFAGNEAIGVLIGAKRPAATLVHKIAVHPDHLRQGHARHMLESLSSKLAILGPRRIVAEVPDTFDAACALFSGCGYVEEACLTDHVWTAGALSEDSADAPRFRKESSADRWVVPVTVDDLAANGLLPQDRAQICWERSVETLVATKNEIAGLAVSSDERIEACILHSATDILMLRSAEDDRALLQQLLARLGPETLRMPKVHPAEVSGELLVELGFASAGGHRLYAATARPG